MMTDADHLNLHLENVKQPLISYSISFCKKKTRIKSKTCVKAWDTLWVHTLNRLVMIREEFYITFSHTYFNLGFLPDLIWCSSCWGRRPQPRLIAIVVGLGHLPYSGGWQCKFSWQTPKACLSSQTRQGSTRSPRPWLRRKSDPPRSFPCRLCTQPGDRSQKLSRGSLT